MLHPYQKRDSSDPSDFKPVSLLGVIGKLQELFVDFLWIYIISS